MEISPENEQFIQYELEFGAFHERGELLDAAVTLLKRRSELQREIQAGIDSGASIPANEVFAALDAKFRQLPGEDLV